MIHNEDPWNSKKTSKFSNDTAKKTLFPERNFAKVEIVSCITHDF